MPTITRLDPDVIPRMRETDRQVRETEITIDPETIKTAGDLFGHFEKNKVTYYSFDYKDYKACYDIWESAYMVAFILGIVLVAAAQLNAVGMDGHFGPNMTSFFKISLISYGTTGAIALIFSGFAGYIAWKKQHSFRNIALSEQQVEDRISVINQLMKIHSRHGITFVLEGRKSSS